MSHDTKRIAPALTPEEWRLVKLWNAGKMPGGKVRGMVVLDLPDEHRHGAAACALHDQPFGFTWEDVDDLNELLAAYDWDSIHGEEQERQDRIPRLIAKIAALLPPRETLTPRSV